MNMHVQARRQDGLGLQQAWHPFDHHSDDVARRLILLAYGIARHTAEVVRPSFAMARKPVREAILRAGLYIVGSAEVAVSRVLINAVSAVFHRRTSNSCKIARLNIGEPVAGLERETYETQNNQYADRR